jgi:hypothetical protein
MLNQQSGHFLTRIGKNKSKTKSTMSKISSIGAIALEPPPPVAADTDPDYTCPNTEGICIEKLYLLIY